MLILCELKKSLTILGILPIKLRQNQSMINWAHIIFIIGLLTCYFSSVLGFLFFRAKTFIQYAECAVFCTVTGMRFAFYIVLVVQKSKLALLMDDLAKIINKRESISLFCLKKFALYNFFCADHPLTFEFT